VMARRVVVVWAFDSVTEGSRIPQMERLREQGGR